MGILLALFLLFFGSGLGAQWEFGEDRKGSVVISTNNGDISYVQKVTRVQFTVPACNNVVYVKVQVKNYLSTPTVSYDKDTYTVIIHYNLLQSSWSTYHIVAKAIKEKNCGKQPRKKKPKDYYQDYDSEEYSESEYDDYKKRSKRPKHQRPSKPKKDFKKRRW